MAKIKGLIKKLRIEIKATRRNRFISLTEKDIKSKYFVWILFDNYFISYYEDKEIYVYIVKDINRYLTEDDLKELKNKIYFNKFSRKVKKDFCQIKDINLTEFLS